MRKLPTGTTRLFWAATLIATGLMASLAFAQFQNPIQAAKDAYKKAKGQPTAQAGGTQPAPATPPTASVGTKPAGAPASAAQASAQPSILIEPPGGVDYSKLPDIEGIHLGMPVQQALTIVKGIYKDNPQQKMMGTVVYNAKFTATSDPPWVAFVRGTKPRSDGQVGDQIEITFSMPPNPQTVVMIQRQIVFEVNAPPTMGNLVNSLRQKYGPEAKVPLVRTNMNWTFDEQGRPVPPSGPVCAGVSQQPASGAGAIPWVVGPSPLDQSDITRLGNQCHTPVNVNSSADPTRPDSLAGSLSVVMTETGQGTRDAIASQKYIDAANAASKQRQIQKGNQQKTPAL